MSDSKRFVCIDIGYGDGWYITDNGERLSEMEIVDLLNKQQDTIQSLNEENERLQKENNILNRNEDDLKECTLENEQLRKENVFLAKQRNYWKGKCDMAVETFETDEATEKKISELEKENERLKSQLNDCGFYLYGMLGEMNSNPVVLKKYKELFDV